MYDSTKSDKAGTHHTGRILVWLKKPLFSSILFLSVSPDTVRGGRVQSIESITCPGVFIDEGL